MPTQCSVSIGSRDTQYNAPKVATAAAANIRDFFVFLLILNPPLQILQSFYHQDDVDCVDYPNHGDYHCRDDHCVSKVLRIHIREHEKLVLHKLYACVIKFDFRAILHFGDVVGFEPTTCVLLATPLNQAEVHVFTSAEALLGFDKFLVTYTFGAHG